MTYLFDTDELAKPAVDSHINEAYISQPATTAVQIGIVMLLRHWNIIPSAVVGHSSGETAAAFSAGILDIQFAMRIAYYRGELALKLKQGFPNLAGGMLAIGASQSEIQRLIDCDCMFERAIVGDRIRGSRRNLTIAATGRI